MVPALKKFTKTGRTVSYHLGENMSIIGGLYQLTGPWWHSRFQSLCPLVLSHTKSCRSPHPSDTACFSASVPFLQVFITFPLDSSGPSRSLHPFCVIPLPHLQHITSLSRILCARLQSTRSRPPSGRPRTAARAHRTHVS